MGGIVTRDPRGLNSGSSAEVAGAPGGESGRLGPMPRTERHRGARAPEPAAARDWLVAALAAVGLVDAAYLTWLKLAGTQALFCRAGSGCDIIQASRYATLLGVPIALWGAALYVAVGGLALIGLTASRWRWAFAGAAGGVALSGYLTYLSVAQLGAACVYCLASGLIMLALLGALVWRRPRPSGRAGTLSPGKLTALGVTAGAATVLAVAFIFAWDTPPATGYEADLARHLAARGAIMYGAFWCPHCQEQKALFGDGARHLPYVECDPKGAGARPDLCNQASVHSYPTWVLGAQRREGVLSLQELAALSGFQPPPSAAVQR